MEILRKYYGNTKEILWKYYGNTREILRKYSGNTMGFINKLNGIGQIANQRTGCDRMDGVERPPY